MGAYPRGDVQRGLEVMCLQNEKVKDAIVCAEAGDGMETRLQSNGSW